ncbi:MAG: DJ-1/PfpI family protein [Candidatus Omnitrophota bacterium]
MRYLKKIFLLGLVFCLFGSFAFAQVQVQKKALMLIAADKFQDDEFFQPKKILEKNGIKVTVASTTLAQITGMNGAKTKANILLSDARVNDYDAVLFIGGSGAVQYLEDPLALRLAQDAVAANKIVGAICIAPRILANAGVLKGKRATVYPTEGKELTACGVKYTAGSVEKDGNIITADGPVSARAFGDEIARALFAR